MLFDVWGSDTLIHWAGWAMVFIGLIVLNEVGRRTKLGAAIIFGVAPLAMTIYCVAIAIGVSQGAEWALTNPTHVYQNSWFHYAKVYAALAGCWGFIAIKYQWGKIGKVHWFRAWPFVIVAINIMIAVVSDFESAYHFFVLGQSTWVTSEGATQLAGWNNVFNGIAGIINIFCMTGWWSVYASEDQTDMLWPDMTWVFIIAYDLWNFAYTYNCMSDHSTYTGLALLIAFGKKPFALTGTLAIMIISMVIRRLPYTIRSSVAILQQIPMSIEEASISLGASKMKTFFRITVPMMSSGIVSGAILSWVSIVTEVSSAVILYNNRSITLTVGTYSAISRGNFGAAAAFATVTTVLTALSLVVYMRVTKSENIEL